MNADETGRLVREVSNSLSQLIIKEEKISWLTDIIMAVSFDDKDQAELYLLDISDELDWR